MPLKFACSVVIVGPVENAVVVPARAAYSHSASVSSLYTLPVLRDSQGRYSFVMSSHDTLITGRFPRPQPSSLGLYLQPPAAAHASHSASVSSNLPAAKGRAMLTLCSLAGDPIMNLPAGTTTISGQSGQSRKLAPEPGLTDNAGSRRAASSSAFRFASARFCSSCCSIANLWRSASALARASSSACLLAAASALARSSAALASAA